MHNKLTEKLRSKYISNSSKISKFLKPSQDKIESYFEKQKCIHY